MSKIKTQYHYFYKITNQINGHFYYGVHNTNNLNDGYMGSGKRLKIAYNKYGIDNFSKEILKYFNTAKEAYEYEAAVVTEDLVNNDICYNLTVGGKGGWEYLNKNFRFVKDKNGNHITVSKDDPRYISGELIIHDKGISKNIGKISVKDKNNKYYSVSINDERYISGELVPILKNKVTVKDKDGNTLSVSTSDPRYILGELQVIWKNKKHSEETKQKIKETKQKNHLQLGKLNSQYGTCWIHNDKENKKIKKEELENYINIGWIKGRKMKF